MDPEICSRCPPRSFGSSRDRPPRRALESASSRAGGHRRSFPRYVPTARRWIRRKESSALDGEYSLPGAGWADGRSAASASATASASKSATATVSEVGIRLPHKHHPPATAAAAVAVAVPAAVSGRGSGTGSGSGSGCGSGSGPGSSARLYLSSHSIESIAGYHRTFTPSAVLAGFDAPALPNSTTMASRRVRS